MSIIEKLGARARPRVVDGIAYAADEGPAYEARDPMAAARAVEAIEAAAAPVEADVAQALADQRLAKQAEEAQRMRRELELNTRRADVLNIATRARMHDGRQTFTPHDASVIWQMEALIHSIAGGRPAPLDNAFVIAPDTTRPINSAVDRAIRMPAAAALEVATEEATDAPAVDQGDAGG